MIGIILFLVGFIMFLIAMRLEESQPHEPIRADLRAIGIALEVQDYDKAQNLAEKLAHQCRVKVLEGRAE